MLIQIEKWSPAELTIAPVDAPCFGLQAVTNITVSLNLTARGRRYLGIADLAVMLREFIQQGFISEESLRQPFGIIQSFNRKDILNVLEFVLELGKLRRQRTRGLLGDFVWLNTNRVDFGMEISSPRGVRFAAVVTSRVLPDTLSRNASLSFSVWKPSRS